MVAYVIVFVSALVLSLIFTRQARIWGQRAGLIDQPDGFRKTHSSPVPRVGGIGIFISMGIVLAGAALFLPGRVFQERIAEFAATLIGGGAIFILGLLDDIFALRASTKFIGQVVIALGMFAAGMAITTIGMAGAQFVLPVWLSALVTVLWIVGLTNAFNLIDGADGVAGGATVFASLSLAVVSFSTGNHVGGVAALALAGAAVGFLYYNFPPATVFLGDCGSLLIGFTLASIGLMTAQATPTLLAVAIPVVSCGLPILDTVLAMTRRFLRGQPIYNADRGHIHHRLRDLGHSPRTVAILLYGASAFFTIVSLLLANRTARFSGVMFAILGVAVWVAVQRLHIPELLEVRRIVQRGMRQRTAIANNVRMREAIARLRVANEPTGIVAALEHGLRSGDFVRAEMWLSRPLCLPLLTAGVAAPNGVGAIWEWHLVGDVVVDVGWEFKMRFTDDSGRVVGRLSLWHSNEDNHLLTDLKLIGSELQPELHFALKRAQHAGRETPVFAASSRSRRAAS